jgi:methyl-accepting chemotaxis protein
VLQQVITTLHDAVRNVKEGVDSIVVASSEIATGNSDLSRRTEAQASSLQEAASSMTQLTHSVKMNADNAYHANELVITASDIASKGNDMVGQVVTTMGSIKDSSRKIVDIISVIDGIAFQTNILALNAAVEAARAGEQGRVLPLLPAKFVILLSAVRVLPKRSRR